MSPRNEAALELLLEFASSIAERTESPVRAAGTGVILGILLADTDIVFAKALLAVEISAGERAMADQEISHYRERLGL